MPSQNLIIQFINPAFLGVELFVSTIVIVLCLSIYFKTKDMFRLTRHKGIDYFRNTFVFLAGAYFFRFVFLLIMLSKFTLDLHFRGRIFNPLFLVIISYFSTMAIISLFLSISWKKIKIKGIDTLTHVVAVTVAVLAFITREPLIIIISQAILLLVTALLSLRPHKKSKKFSKLFAIYILLFLFWIVGLIPLGSRRLIPCEFNIAGQIIALIVFIIIYYKVSKWIK